jgi:uncharacterized membrane protein
MDRLEARIGALERALSAPGASAAGAVPPGQAPSVPPPPPMAPPAGRVAPSGPGWVLPKGATGAPRVPSPGPALPGPPRASEPLVSGAPLWGGLRIDLSLPEVRARLTGRALAWVGGAALILGAILFLGLAFDRGWIGPELRVLIGLAAGLATLIGGALVMDRGNRLVGHVLTAVGLAVISVSLVAATRLYGLIPVEIGLVAALVTSVGAAFIAIRADAPVVAGFGLAAVLLAPPMLGARPDLVTVAFVAIVLVGTTAVALWRTWAWLPGIAFVLAAPQAASWLAGRPELAPALVGIATFWLLNIVAAGGEEFRRRRDDLSPSSTTLLLATAAFSLWAGFVTLDGDLAMWRGLFLLLLSLAHLGIGGYFVSRDGERNLFGLLAIGTGVAVLTMAAPVQLGASAVPLAWTAEAVALAWLGIRRGHPYSAIVSAILYGLAGLDLLVLFASHPGVTTLLDADGAALAFFLGGVAGGVYLLRDGWMRESLLAFGLLIAAACTMTPQTDAAWVVSLTVLLVTGTAYLRWHDLLPDGHVTWRLDGLIPRSIQAVANPAGLAGVALPSTLLLLGTTSTITLLLSVFHPGWAAHEPLSTAFLDAAGLSLGVYLVGLAIVGWLVRRPRVVEGLASLGIIVTGWACVAELEDTWVVATLTALMVLAFAIRRARAARAGSTLGTARAPVSVLDVIRGLRTLDLDETLPSTALLVGASAAIHIMLVELPPARFGRVLPPPVPFSDAGALVAAILGVGILLAGLIVGDARGRRWSTIAFGLLLAYTIPYEVFAWAVAVLWSALAVTGILLADRDRSGRDAIAITSMALLGCAAAVAIAIVAPPARLVVGSVGVQPVDALQSAAALAVVVIGTGAMARSRATSGHPRAARWARLAAGVVAVYALSVLVVDTIATQVGGPVALDELRTWGQVALSVTWTVIGVVALVGGQRERAAEFRQAGLALLALATTKVFIFDLAALDVAYRVISLVVLGALLIVSAWLWQRSQRRPPITR